LHPTKGYVNIQRRQRHIPRSDHLNEIKYITSRIAASQHHFRQGKWQYAWNLRFKIKMILNLSLVWYVSYRKLTCFLKLF